jgi:UDP-GlcNAc:undecaprenyl-phosphate/decaprenyl-phosphate GlcNAc-1-phosphate transferase
MQDMTVLIAAFLLTALLIYGLSPFARRLGLLDFPTGRKNHGRPVPIIGGIAMVACFMGLLPLLSSVPANVSYQGMALALICVTGILDDLHDLSAKRKFLLQIIAALIMTILAGLCVENLGNLFGLGQVHTGPLKVIFTIICILGVINAINMEDGVDGLAGSMVVVACGWYAILAWLSGAVNVQALALLLASTISGFLMFNLRNPWRSQASVFMGDSGSMSLGLLLTWFAVELSGYMGSKVTPITAVWVLALPLIDMACVMARRIRKGVNPFAADREHLHHILLRAGCSIGQTVAIKVGISFVLGGIGVATWIFRVPEYVMFYAFMAILGLYYYGTSHAWRLVKTLRRQPRGAKPPGYAEQAQDAPLD